MTEKLIIKDLTPNTAEDISEWKETFEIMSDKNLMRQIRAADKSRREGKRSDFIPWEKVKRDHSNGRFS